MMRLIVFVLIFVFSNTSFAAISSVNVSGSGFEISGSGFGVKTTATPILWDNFETGTDGANIGTSGTWCTENGFLYSDDLTQRHSGSSLFLKAQAEAGVVSGDTNILVNQWASSKKKLMCGWYRVDFITMDSGQIKVMDIERAETHATAPGIAESTLWCYEDSCSDGGVTSQLGTGSGNLAYWYQGPTLVLLQQFTFAPYRDNQWQYMMIEYEESDYGVANGNVNIYKSSTTETPTAIQKISSTNKLSQIEEGSVAEYAKLRAIIVSGATRADVYYDDIYIDNSWARVEMGDNAVYGSCTHREIQPALTWSDTGITGTFNRGSFETGETVYFFVIDEDGTPSDGYAVVIGGESIANPIVEILTETGQTTTASIFEITGTVTADTDQTISGVTCDGQTVIPDDGTWDEQVEAFTCLANLSLGENVLVFIGSDGTRTGSDSATITRTIPGEYTTRGAGFSIKGCTLK